MRKAAALEAGSCWFESSLLYRCILCGSEGNAYFD